MLRGRFGSIFRAKESSSLICAAFSGSIASNDRVFPFISYQPASNNGYRAWELTTSGIANECLHRLLFLGVTFHEQDFFQLIRLLQFHFDDLEIRGLHSASDKGCFNRKFTMSAINQHEQL